MILPGIKIGNNMDKKLPTHKQTNKINKLRA